MAVKCFDKVCRSQVTQPPNWIRVSAILGATLNGMKSFGSSHELVFSYANPVRRKQSSNDGRNFYSA